MAGRMWLYAATALDLFLLVPGFYMAISAVDVVSRSERSPYEVGIGVLFFALPVFAIACPLAGWRARRLRRPTRNVVGLFAAPWVYAAFLVAFLNYG